MFRKIALSLASIFALCVVLLGDAPSVQSASTWPSRSITIIVPFAPGGSNDVIARQLAIRLTKALGQPVVVENRAGGGSVVGSHAVATSSPDGYTFLFVSGSLATSAAVQKTPYDTLKAFDAVGRVANAPFVVLTRQGFPAKNIKELVAYAKANPGKINFGSAGLGDSSQMATELFGMVADIKMVAVGYKGIAPAQLDVVAGRLDLVITTIASIKGTVADNLPKLAFTTATREPDYPDVPTVRESGLDYVVDVWWGVFAPRGIPAEIRSRMNREIAAVTADKEFAGFLKSISTAAAPSSPEELQALLAKDLERWTAVAKRVGIYQQ